MSLENARLHHSKLDKIMTTPIEHVSVYFEWIHLDDLTNMNASRDELKGQKVRYYTSSN